MFRKHLASAVSDFCKLTADQLDALEAHYRLMVRWNKVLNLTRIESEKEAAELHYAESIFVGQQLPAGALRVVDLGSGAGFPGFPVAIARPECSVTLVEAHQRKAVFLREAARTVANVSVLGTRAEVVDGGFDWVVCRAVNWQEIEPIAFRLAPKVAFVGAAGEIRIPWGENRFVALVDRPGTAPSGRGSEAAH